MNAPASSRTILALGLMVGSALWLRAAPASAQDAPVEPLEVGAPAPAFEIAAATRHGLLQDPVSLSEFEGKTVVLSFFYAARTKG